MKLGYVCQFFSAEFRGPVTNMLEQIAESIEVDCFASRRRHLQYYNGGQEAEAEKLAESLQVRRYECRFSLGGLLFPSGLEGLLEAEKPTVLQTEEYYQPASHITCGFAKKNRIPFIVNHRASEARTRTLKERGFFRLANPLSRKVVDDAAAVMCLSQRGRQALLDVYPHIGEKIRVIPNSISPSWGEDADGRRFRFKYGIKGDPPIVLLVGRVHPQKRIDLLVKAFAKVQDKVREAHLVIVGPWPDQKEKSRLDKLISAEQLTGVHLLGKIPNQEIKDAYGASQLVVLTSEYEPFGYTLLEAMSVGKPVVGFDVGAVSEIIQHGKNGHVVPFPDVAALADRITYLLDDVNRRRRFGEKSRQIVNEKFNLTENAKKMLALYEEVSR